ncbi:uncharacterized protein UDID_19217 [Ustilago sp. UG-2017a]|nr:uncharacterized protein UDID_19217 [Ustilago sp. UG-2017a]
MIDLDQRAYIKEIINEWIMPDQKTWVPMTKAPTKAPEGLEIKDNLKRNATKQAMQVVLCGVKYLNQTQDGILQIGGEDMDGSTIKAYTDANWASDANTDWKSTSGSIIKMYVGVVTWNLHVQKCVASSAVEAKYVASSEGDIAMQYIKTDNSVADFLTKTVSQHLLACTRHTNANLAHSGVYHITWIDCADTGIGIPVNR